MPGPFSRSESASSGGGSGEAAARQGEARDPAAELRARTRRRLIGAAVLLLGAVIVLPMLLDTAPRQVRDDIAITVDSPPPAPAAKAPEAAGAPPAVDVKIGEPAPVRNDAEPTEPPPAAAKPAELPPAPPAVKAARPAPAGRAEPPTPKAPSATASGKYAVQVAALSAASAAEELHVQLIKGGFSSYVESVTTAAGPLHRVRVGPFASRDDAQRAADRLKAAGHKSAVVGG